MLIGASPLTIMSPTNRDDISRFLVHFTRPLGEHSADDNLINILRVKTIEARSAHCLFQRKLGNLRANLKQNFNTVCFTETPLPQLRRYGSMMSRERIRDGLYGLVFDKRELIGQGVSPVMYINAEGTKLRRYLLKRFDADLKALGRHQDQGGDLALSDTDSMVQYYSLISKTSEDYDFSWEREWRALGDFHFTHGQLKAIIAANPEEFMARCRKEAALKRDRQLANVPVVSPDWDYEALLEHVVMKPRRIEW